MLYIGIALHGTECWVDITYHPSHTHTDVYTSLFFVHELLCSLGQVVFCLCMYCIWCTHTHDQSGPAWMRFSCFLLFLLLTFVRLTVRCEREHGWMVKIGENANINTWNIICKEKRKKRWANSSSSSRGSGAEVPAARYHWNGHRNMLRTPKNCPTLNASINYLIIIVRFTSFFFPFIHSLMLLLLLLLLCFVALPRRQYSSNVRVVWDGLLMLLLLYFWCECKKKTYENGIYLTRRQCREREWIKKNTVNY